MQSRVKKLLLCVTGEPLHQLWVSAYRQLLACVAMKNSKVVLVIKGGLQWNYNYSSAS